MELQLKNIGMITEANVKIDGLTVIAGENDTGKSTVGKVLFCTIKSSAMSDGRFFYTNRAKYINKLFSSLKNFISISSSNSIQYSQLASKVNDIKDEVNHILRKKTDKEQYLQILDKLKNDNSLNTLPLFDEIYEKLANAIEEDFKNEFTANNFNTIMSYAFANDFFSHYQEKQNLTVTLKNEIKNQQLKFILNETENKFIGNKIFDDVLYIDTPVIFQLIKLLNDTALNDKEYMPTIKDLKQKLLDLPQKVEVWEQEEIQQVAKHIREIIGGDIENKGTDIVYTKPNSSQSIKIENTATGIKSFGLILLLLKQGYIHNQMVLIFDEPEVHLHPKWQIKMAEVIIMLVKFGVKIIVNSHSPYLIDALKYYADKEKVNNNFYLAEKSEYGTSSISDVTMDISPIFEKLTEPLRNLRKQKLGLK